MNFLKSVPVIGAWLRVRQVRMIVGDTQDGDPAAVTGLCNILCDSEDARARALAASALAGLQDPGMIQAFLEESLVRNNPMLNRLAKAYSSGPDGQEMQVLLLFVAGDREQYRAFDPPPHALLARGYAGSGRRIRAAVRRAGRGDPLQAILVQILCDIAQAQDPAILCPEEWEILFTGLVEERRWKELHALVFFAPVPLAVRALHALRESGWRPGGDDCGTWDRVMRELPEIWSHPLPVEGPSMTIGPGDALVTRYAFSRDGTHLALGTCYGSVQVWNTRTGIPAPAIQVGKEAVSSIVFSADNRFLICCEDSDIYRCREARSGEVRWEYRGSGKNLPACTPILLPDGLSLVVSSKADQLTVLSVEDGLPVCILSGLPSPAVALAVSSDTAGVFAGCADGSVCSGHPVGGSVAMLLEGQGNPVRSLGVSGDGECVTVVFDASPPVLVRKDGTLVRRFTGHAGRVTVAAIARDGSCLAVGSSNGVLNIWRHNDAVPVRSLQAGTKRPTACSFTPDGRSLAVGFNNGTVMLRCVGGGGPEWEHRAHRKGIMSLSLSPDGTLIFSTGWDRSVRLWDARTGDAERTLVHEYGGVTGTCLLDNGNIIAAAYSRGAVTLYQRDTGERIRSLNRYMRNVKAIVSNHTGTLLAIAGGDNTLLCWNINDDSVTPCEGLRGPPRCLAFIPGEDILISGGWDGKVRLWDMPRGTLLATLSGHSSTITSCAASPDGSILATASNDRTVQIWLRKTGRAIRLIQGSRTEVSALAFSPDGCHLAAAGADECIRVCRMPDGARDRDISGIPGKVTALVFTEDGQFLAAGYDTGTLVLVSWEERRIIHTIHAHAGPVTGMTVLPGGNSVITGSADGSLRLWRLPPAPALAEKTLEDIDIISNIWRSLPPGKESVQWKFLRTLLSAQFSDIELCPDQTETGEYEIQIVG